MLPSFFCEHPPAFGKRFGTAAVKEEIRVMDDERDMRLALDEARLAAFEGEVPVGAVLVREGKVIASGHNRREQRQSALSHAEIEVIDRGCAALQSWRLSGCTLYVTLEPCPMCAGAIINARIDRLVYGAADDKAGSVGSLIHLFAVDYNHTPRVTTGVLAEECGSILAEIFGNLRKI